VVCKEAIENCYHLFFHCSTAVNVWSASGVWSRLEPLVQQYQSAEDVIFIMLQHGNSSQVESLATILWRCGRAEISEFGSKLHKRIAAFWSVRSTYWRIAVMRTGFKMHTLLVQSIIVAAIARQQPCRLVVQQISRTVEQRWWKPAMGRLKCNVDASSSTSLNRVGIGMCIRDEEGCYVLSTILWITPLCLVEVDEALGLYHTIV